MSKTIKFNPAVEEYVEGKSKIVGKTKKLAKKEMKRFGIRLGTNEGKLFKD